MVYFVSNEDVERLISVEEGMQAIENAYREWDAGRAAIRPKTNLYVFNSEDHTRYNYTSMEGAIQTLGIFAIRMRSDLSPHPRRSPTDLREAGGEGQHCGLIMFFSSRTGEPLAIANDGLLQHVRVGATAAIAAKYMARPDASVLGLLGSQWM